MRIPPSLSALALAGVLTVGTVGCSSGKNADGEGGGGTGLERALGAAPSSVGSKALTYFDVRTARKLVAKDEKLYRVLNGYGIGELSDYAGNPRENWGFDEKDVRTAFDVQGQSSRLTGTFDTEAIAAALKKKGFRAGSAGDGTRFEEPGKKGSTFEVTESVRVRSDSDRAFALSLAEPENSLTDDPAYAAVADCLGDVYYASFYAKRKKGDVVLLAIGGRLDAGGTSSETICTVNASKKAADRTAAKLRTKTAKGEPYAGSTVATGDGDAPVVSMTWKTTSKSGHLPRENDQTSKLPRLLLLGWG
ncbi:hypothetical protein [Streptomyces sp. NBC_01304]|uniref:hypothetical protein n=1 Tax=Streptomyces sp. NBC_01304 TaxID=2903818 RepID=UPI002E0D6800|nr:hypothetical protein OG430_46045 [Streptomyces sp. NBC_01304]